jgi:hypothetical protein
MTDIKKKVEKEVEVGFNCDLCHKDYVSGYNAHLHPDSKVPYSTKGTLHIDDSDSSGMGWKSADLCHKCFDTIAKIFETLGGKFNGL